MATIDLTDPAVNPVADLAIRYVDRRAQAAARRSQADQAIVVWVESLPPGTFITPDSLRGLPGFNPQWSWEYLRGVLEQLVAECELMWVDDAVYFTPFRIESVGSTSITDTLAAFTERSEETITCTVGTAANALRLMDQCPMWHERYTSGRSRVMRLGKTGIDMRHVADWQLLLGDTKPGLAIRYFSWWYDADDEESWEYAAKRAPEDADELHTVLSPQDWQAIDQVAHKLPDWVYDAIERSHRRHRPWRKWLRRLHQKLSWWRLELSWWLRWFFPSNYRKTHPR